MSNQWFMSVLLVAALQALPASARARDNSQTGLPPVYENLTQGLLLNYVGDEVRIVTADSLVVQGRLLAVDSLAVILKNGEQTRRVGIAQIKKIDFPRSHVLTVFACVGLIFVPLTLLFMAGMAAE